MTKIKINKDDTIYFDGERVSNGHWLAPRGMVKLSDSAMQGLIEAGVRFDRRGGGKINFGPEAVVPDMGKWASPPAGMECKPFDVLKLAVTHHAKSHGWVVLLTQDGAGLVGIDEDYFAMVEGATEGVLRAWGPNWFKVGGEFIVIMPIALDGVREKLEAGLKACGEE